MEDYINYNDYDEPFDERFISAPLESLPFMMMIEESLPFDNWSSESFPFVEIREELSPFVHTIDTVKMDLAEDEVFDTILYPEDIFKETKQEMKFT